MKYNTEKLVRKFENKQILGGVLIPIGVLLLIFSKFNLFLNITMPILGVVTLISNRKRIKELKGEFIESENNTLRFMSRGEEMFIKKGENNYTIHIKLDEIDIIKNDVKTTVFLDDYPDYDTRKKIKAEFASFSFSPNNSTL